MNSVKVTLSSYQSEHFPVQASWTVGTVNHSSVYASEEEAKNALIGRFGSVEFVKAEKDLLSEEILEAEAVYTGGGIYVHYGRTESAYFFAYEDCFYGVMFLDSDPRSDYDESAYSEWQEAHKIVEESETDDVYDWFDKMYDLEITSHGCPLESDVEDLKEELRNYRMSLKEGRE